MKRSASASPVEQESFADEIDRRVAQRTAELTATIEQLRRELAERQRAEGVLREEELFSLIVESIPVPVAVTSPTGEVEALNKPTLEYFGRTFDELKGWKSSDVVHPDDLERTVATQMEAVQTGSAYNVESRHRRADGTYRWFNVLGLPLRDSQGHILRWFILQIDIDDRKRAEEALRSAERNLSLTIDTIPTFISVCKPDGTVLSVSQAALDYHGITLEDVQKEDFRTRFFHPDDAGRWREQRNEALKRSVPFEYEQRALGKDGKYRWFLVRCNPLLDDQGKIDRWYATAFDIEDRKLAEDAQVRQAGVRADVSAAFSKPTHLGEILQGCTEAIVRHLDAAFARIWILNKDESVLELKASAGMYTRLDGSYSRISVGDLKVGLIAREKKAHLTNDVLNDPRVNDKAWAQSNGMVAFAGYPLVVEDRLIGVVALFARHTLPESILDTLASVADTIAQGIERKRAEESLRNALDEVQKSEAKLRQVIDAIPTLAWCNLPDGPNEFLNKGWHEYTGLTPEQSHGWGWQAAFHPDDLPSLMGRWMTMLVSGEPDEIEARLRRHDGVFRWFLIRAEPFRDESGEIVRWYGTSTDIDDRKRAEEELRRSEAFLAEAQQLSLMGSFSWRLGTNEITWSEELYRIYEFEPGVPVTVDLIRTRVHPEDLTLYEKMVEQARNGAEDFEWQYRLLMPDQSIKYMHAVARATRNNDGQLEYVAAVQDITRRKLREEKLRRSEAFLAEGQHLARMGNFWWRVTTNEILWSEPMYRIFEFEPATTVTLEMIAKRIHPDDISVLQDMIERGRRGEDFEYEHRIVMPDGSVKYLHIIAHGAADQHRGPEYIGAVQDVTQRHLSEEALSKARSELAHVSRAMSLGTLTASIAHEVNQPLSGIITNASTCVRMLDADPPNVDGARETAKRTIRDGRRAADVITRLRALFARKETVDELVDLNDATREVIALSRSELERNRVITKTELAEQLPLITGDRVQLQQVIMNLLRNGSDAMTDVDDRPRELLFRTEVEEGDRVRVSVQDSGIGFTGQSLDQLFQSFYTTKQDGMGIGLSVSRSIIENHGGRLWATPNDGPGVTFSFSVPCVED